MGAARKLAGKKFGRLLVLKGSDDARVGYACKRAYWVCVCDCGNVCEVASNKLTTFITQSCGCLHSEILAKLNRDRTKYPDEQTRRQTSLQQQVQWRSENPDRCRELAANWRAANLDRHRANCRKNHVKRAATDTPYCIARNLRSRFYGAIKGNFKGGSAVRDLGCSIPELIERFAFFWPEYTWDKYGSEWEIDHIRPLASFDLTDPAQIKVACNYANLQPLGGSENRSKGAKYDLAAAYNCAV